MPAQLAGWFAGDNAMGSWWGARDSLAQKGIEFCLTYTNNIAGNPVGGLSRGMAYADNFNLGLDVDLEKLAGWRGGSLHFIAVDRNGRSLSQDHIGNQFTVQQVYGGQNMGIYLLALRQELFDGKLMLKAGRVGAGDDFASSPLYGFYMNNAIDGNLQNIPVNSQFSTYPNGVWGGLAKWQFAEAGYLQGGLYQVPERGGLAAPYYGLNWGFSRGDGVMFLFQAGWTPVFAKTPGGGTTMTGVNSGKTAQGTGKSGSSGRVEATSQGLPGHYFAGAYASTFAYDELDSEGQQRGAYGFYFHGEQMVWRCQQGQGELWVWSALGFSPQEAIALLPFQWNAGAVYRGLLPGRPEDEAVFGLGWGVFSRERGQSPGGEAGAGGSSELMWEWGYRVELSEFLYVQPDVQWIVRPSGRRDVPNALVLGAQIGVVF